MATKKPGWADLLGTPAKGSAPDEVPDTEQPPPVTVLMHTIVGNPDNPRPEDDYNDSDPEFRELKASMKEIGQLQPVAVVSRGVFEQAKPAAVAAAKPAVRKLLTEADWVVVTGNRRLAAARQLGWTRIDIRVQDQLGDEEGRIDEAVIIENIHRKNLAPIKEAEYLAGMLERHGSQDKVAERIGKSQMYVSHRLALLKLAPDIQAQVDAGEVKLKDARLLAGKTRDHEEQRQRVAELQAEAAKPKPLRAVRTDSDPAVQNPVLNPAPSSGDEASAGGLQNPVLKTDAASPGQSSAESSPVPPREPEGPAPVAQAPVPQQPTAEAPAHPPTPVQTVSQADGERRQVKMPWHDGNACAEIAIQKMTPTERRRLAERLIQQDLVEREQTATPSTV